MTEERLEIRVPANKSRERLDLFLAHVLEQTSRSQVQRWIREGQVLVDGRAVKPNHLIRPLEVITVTISRHPPEEIQPEDIPLDIVYEDDALLVVNKPAGMVVHPAQGNWRGTLVNALLGYGASLSFMNGPCRPGIVHRLDKDTSGLLVVAKTDEAHRQLALQFSRKSVEREYVALVWWPIPKKRGTIEAGIDRSRQDRKKMSVSQTGRSAVTHYEVLERFPFLTLCRLFLETGRTHQIRVHLSHVGHPVFGDQTYGGRSRPLGRLKREEAVLAARWLEQMPRQALHARTLGFIHPEKKTFMRFESELPEDMQRLLETIRTHYHQERGLP